MERFGFDRIPRFFSAGRLLSFGTYFMLLGTFHRLEPIISARIKLTGSPFSELAIALFINQSVVPFRSVRFCPKFKKEVLRPDSEALLFCFCKGICLLSFGSRSPLAALWASLKKPQRPAPIVGKRLRPKTGKRLEELICPPFQCYNRITWSRQHTTGWRAGNEDRTCRNVCKRSGRRQKLF